MARIVRVHEAGGPEVLQLDEVDVPPPGPGEVAIRVAAIGLNRAETYLRRGLYGMLRPGEPSPIGAEAAGVVDAVGPGVEGFAPGDRVTVLPGAAELPFGAYGELIIAPSHAVIAQPANLSVTEAAALWGAWLTAYAPMVEIAKVSPGDVVLLNAATSSVGVAAISIVNSLGGVPVAMTRDRGKTDRLRAAGAAHVIVTGEDDLVGKVKEITDGKLARVAFDPVAGDALAQLLDAVSTGGILVHYGSLSQQPTMLPSSMLMRNLTITGYALDIGYNPGRRERAVRFISEGVARGAFRPIVARTFPIDQVAAAHAELEANRHVGKIVLTTDSYDPA